MRPKELVVRDKKSQTEVAIDISGYGMFEVDKLREKYPESIRIDELSLFSVDEL